MLMLMLLPLLLLLLLPLLLLPMLLLLLQLTLLLTLRCNFYHYYYLLLRTGANFHSCCICAVPNASFQPLSHNDPWSFPRCRVRHLTKAVSLDS